MTHINKFALPVLVACIIIALTMQAGMRPDLGAPVAIDKNGNTEVYVLNSEGMVQRFQNTGTGFQRNGRFPITGFPVDFTYSVSDQVASLFICSTVTGKGVISRYSLDGSLMKRWWLWHTCGGVDFDYVDHMLYTAATDTNELYRIDVRKGGEPESVGELPGSGQIGPIAVVPGRKLAYVSNVSEGNVYEYDIATRKSRIVGTHLGSPVALNYDSDNRLLYVADATAKRILAVSLDMPGVSQRATKRVSGAAATKPQVRVILQGGALSNPSGVSRITNGDFIVSDFSARRIFALSPTGTVKFQYPP